MNKGTARLIKNIKQFPGAAVAKAGHDLGIAAKPVEKTTTREYMDLVKEIYFTPGAIEQIGNTLNGMPDKKGPLLKVQRQMVMKNPAVSTLVKKLCIEKAVSTEVEHTWDSFFEGVNLSGTARGKKLEDYKDFLTIRDGAFKELLEKRINFKEFTSQFDKLISVSIVQSKKMLSEIDKVMQVTADRPKWEEQRKKSTKKIDQPTIAIIEKMNGSDDHFLQAESFIDYMEGRCDLDAISSGPYSYNELAKMAVSQDSRRCVAEMGRLQVERSKSYSSEVVYPEKMTDDEKKRIEDAKKNSEDQMKGVTKKHKASLDSGEVGSLSDYATRIGDLLEEEREARGIHSKTIFNVNSAISNRMHVDKLKANLDEVRAAQQSREEHYRQLEKIGSKAAMLYPEDIVGEFEHMQEILKNNKGTYGDEDGRNENSTEDKGDER